ncbi:hypothetical protein H1S01_03000 [Heliobacterium chlorum]|uniref:Uncharacterized protein n=1 Tax=Heliobacterium chlorum TaxID=2698 RepID=A0ABR7SY69_HELCL|nr:hypothetical protein [Heliobacterium chlorum]MBC9783478.1 hypothetical protein [Heliobacterium chlorum]
MNYNTQDYLYGQMAQKERNDLEIKLLSIYDKYVEFKRVKESLEDEIMSLNSLPDKVLEMQSLMSEKKSKFKFKEYLHDVLHHVWIDQHYLDFTFCHPFGGMKEAHTFDVSTGYY